MPQQLNEKITERLVLERDRSKLPEGVLCSAVYPISEFDTLNRNRRKYSKSLWEKVCANKDLMEKLQNRKLYGHAEHPATTQSNLEKISHIITKMWIDESKNRVYQEMHVLDTPYGRIVDTLLRAESLVGVSTRAEGELQEQVDEGGAKYLNVVAESFNYVTTDFTADESTPCALPEQIERDLVGHIQAGMAEKKMDKDFAVQMLERMKSTQAVALLENIKAGTSLKETDVHVGADGGVNVNAAGVSVTVAAPAVAAPAPVVPPAMPELPGSAMIPDTTSTTTPDAVIGASAPAGDLGAAPSDAMLTDEKKAAQAKVKAKEVGSKAVGKITFESFQDMLKYFEREVLDPKSEFKRKLTLSESKIVLESQKEIKGLHIKFAESMAERDVVLENNKTLESRIVTLETELKSFKENQGKGAKDASDSISKLTSQLTESHQMNAKLRAKAAKVEGVEKYLAAGLKENKKLLDENTILKQELKSFKESQDKVLIKKYVEMKGKTLGFTVSPNALTLLESCNTENEVDVMLEQLRDAMREKSLHSGGGAAQKVIEGSGAIPQVQPSGLEHQIGSLYGSIR
jgi:cell division septum initiation protein DivIVA